MARNVTSILRLQMYCGRRATRNMWGSELIDRLVASFSFRLAACVNFFSQIYVPPLLG